MSNDSKGLLGHIAVQQRVFIEDLWGKYTELLEEYKALSLAHEEAKGEIERLTSLCDERARKIEVDNRYIWEVEKKVIENVVLKEQVDALEQENRRIISEGELSGYKTLTNPEFEALTNALTFCQNIALARLNSYKPKPDSIYADKYELVYISDFRGIRGTVESALGCLGRYLKKGK